MKKLHLGFILLSVLFLLPAAWAQASYDPDLLSPEDLMFSIITGAGPGGSSHIRAFDENGTVNSNPDKLFAYGEDFHGGVYVTTGDIDADGLDEIITAPRAGGGPQVRVFEKDGTQRGIEIWPFHPESRTGISVAAGDTDGDGKDEIAVAQAEGGRAWVKVYRYNSAQEVLGEWNAFGDVESGASVTMSDIDNDGKAEVIVGSGPTGRGQVRIFEADGTFINQFYIFEEGYRGGINLAAGDTDGDELAKEIVIAKQAEAAEIKVVRYGSSIETLSSFRAFNDFAVGAFVAVSDFDFDGRDEILVGASEGGGPQVEAYDGEGNKLETNFFAYDEGLRGGTDVAGGFFTLRDGTPHTFVGAGDIADCAYEGAENTAQLLDSISGTVFTAGDNAYPSGTASEFADCYDPTWGRHKSRTKPVPGNHDYLTANAAAYFDYFGAAAGDPDKGYYSYDVGPWHMVALNSNCSEVGGCEADSLQEQWLEQDLATNDSDCTLAYMHHPRFSSGSHGDVLAMQPFWQDLYEADADIVVAGHDHTYERFLPQDPSGNLDLSNGLVQFVAGLGGRTFYDFPDVKENSVIRYNGSHGVLKFTLYARSYEWEFIPIEGFNFSDKGQGWCH